MTVVEEVLLISSRRVYLLCLFRLCGSFSRRLVVGFGLLRGVRPTPQFYFLPSHVQQPSRTGEANATISSLFNTAESTKQMNEVRERPGNRRSKLLKVMPKICKFSKKLYIEFHSSFNYLPFLSKCTGPL